MGTQNRNLCLKILVNKNRKKKRSKRNDGSFNPGTIAVHNWIHSAYMLHSQHAQESHTCVAESLGNHPARQKTKAVPWQCTNHLHQENPTYCKSEAASVLYYSVLGELGITTERLSKTMMAAISLQGQARNEPLPAAEAKRGLTLFICVENCPDLSDLFLSHTCTGVIATTTTCHSCVCHAETPKGEPGSFLLLESGVSQFLPF